MAELTIDICGVEFPSCVTNTAGARDESIADLHALGESKSGAIVIKSATKEPRKGNPLPRYRDVELGSINSMGLPNLGYARYVEEIPKLKTYGKPVIATISGMGQGDNELMVEAYDKAGADFIEVNLSCPNIAGEGQLGYNFAASRKMLQACRKLTKRPLGPKLPPYFDPHHFETMAAVLKETKVDFVSTINSIGLALYIDVAKEQKVIAPNQGFGGLGGRYVKPTALANVHKFYQLLDGKVPILGVGGVMNGSDVFEHLLAGASLVEVGSVLMQEGFQVFGRLRRELSTLLDEHGYANPSAVRGKLKDLPEDDTWSELKEKISKARRSIPATDRARKRS